MTTNQQVSKQRRNDPTLYERVRRWRTKHPERFNAHKAVFVALRAGRLKKQPCFCGDNNTEAHHTDYTKALDVVWLCKEHHKKADLERRAG